MPGTVAVLQVGRQHHHQQDQPHGIDQEVPLASGDFLARVVTALVAAFGALDTLAVNDRGTRLALPLVQQAEPLPQMRVDGLPQTADFPASEVMIDGTPWREVGGQIAPLAAGLVEIEDRVEQFPVGVLAGSAPPPRFVFGETIGDTIPFRVRQVRGITHPQLVRNPSPKYNNDNGKSFLHLSNTLLPSSHTDWLRPNASETFF